MREKWTHVPQDQLEEACTHVHDHDYPECLSTLQDMAGAAGLNSTRLISRHAQHYTLLFSRLLSHSDPTALASAGARAPAGWADAPDKTANRRKATGLREAPLKGRLRIAINVASPALADRIASVLSNVEDVELVGASLEADAVIVATTAPRDADAEVALTARELEVLALLAEGASNKLIARRLGISTHTAKYHVASLLEKLDAVSRTDAVTSAARIGVLHL